MRPRLAHGALPPELPAPAREAGKNSVPRASLAHTLHWLLLVLSLLSMVLGSSVPAFANPGRAQIRADGEAHATRTDASEHGPSGPLDGGRGEFELVEDELEPESEDDHGPVACMTRVEISTHSIGPCSSSACWRLARSHVPPLTGSGCIRGPPPSRSLFLSN